jgi:hypothetical protein
VVFFRIDIGYLWVARFNPNLRLNRMRMCLSCPTLGAIIYILLGWYVMNVIATAGSLWSAASASGGV